MYDDYSVFVSMHYDEQAVSAIKKLPSRVWDKKNTAWEIPLDKLETLLAALPNKDFHLIGDLSKLSAIKKIPNSITHTFKTTPFQHQVDGFMYGIENERFILGDEQGLGKTKQAIDIAVYRKQPHTKCLIVTGVNSIKWNWQKEIERHSDETGWILGQRQTKAGVRIGSSEDKLKDVINMQDIDSYFLITNIETLRNADIALELKRACDSGAIHIVVMDEIHKIKNPTASQSKGMLKLLPKVRIAMTGTPLMNTPLDIFIILKWLGYEKNSFYIFKNHHCVMGGYGGYEVMGYKNLDELQKRLDKVMLRRKKEDVLDLPEKIYIDEYLEMTGKQEQIYKEVSMEIKSNIDKIKMKNNPLAELIRLRQATGYTGILSTTVLESSKLDRLEELAEEAVMNNQKIVIFSNWVQMLDPAFERLSKNYRGGVITGHTKDSERQAIVDDFQNSADCVFIMGTIGAMGTGITLTAGTVVIFLDEPWTMANKQQAIDRCHRIGTTSNITIHTLLCKDTIDERIHEIVEKKGAMSDFIVDGIITGDKAELLRFLLS